MSGVGLGKRPYLSPMLHQKMGLYLRNPVGNLRTEDKGVDNYFHAVTFKFASFHVNSLNSCLANGPGNRMLRKVYQE